VQDCNTGGKRKRRERERKGEGITYIMPNSPAITPGATLFPPSPSPPCPASPAAGKNIAFVHTGFGAPIFFPAHMSGTIGDAGGTLEAAMAMDGKLGAGVGTDLCAGGCGGCGCFDALGFLSVENEDEDEDEAAGRKVGLGLAGLTGFEAGAGAGAAAGQPSRPGWPFIHADIVSSASAFGGGWRLEGEEELHMPARAPRKGRLSHLDGEDWASGAGDAVLLETGQSACSQKRDV